MSCFITFQLENLKSREIKWKITSKNCKEKRVLNHLFHVSFLWDMSQDTQIPRHFADYFLPKNSFFEPLNPTKKHFLYLFRNIENHSFISQLSTSQRLTELSELPAIPSAVASATETKLGALFSPCLSVTWPHDYLPYSNHSLDCRIAWKFQKMIRESQTRHFSLFGAIEAKMTFLAFGLCRPVTITQIC